MGSAAGWAGRPSTGSSMWSASEREALLPVRQAQPVVVVPDESVRAAPHLLGRRSVDRGWKVLEARQRLPWHRRRLLAKSLMTIAGQPSTPDPRRATPPHAAALPVPTAAASALCLRTSRPLPPPRPRFLDRGASLCFRGALIQGRPSTITGASRCTAGRPSNGPSTRCARLAGSLASSPSRAARAHRRSSARAGSQRPLPPRKAAGRSAAEPP